eukprot:SAG22_NODE_14_length_33165_cov_13.196698_31_plen_95_part_00
MPQGLPSWTWTACMALYAPVFPPVDQPLQPVEVLADDVLGRDALGVDHCRELQHTGAVDGQVPLRQRPDWSTALGGGWERGRRLAVGEPGPGVQ